MKKYAYSKASKTYLSITNNVSQSYDIVNKSIIIDVTLLLIININDMI